jgi:predicted DNA-binding transcriptional regulator YafY
MDGGMLMYAKLPKKLLIINILEILRKYTDQDHRLSQREIVELLERDYNMVVDRKAVKRNLMNLIEFGYNLEYSESIRTGKNGEEETIYTDWYLERDFSDAELRLLIDSLLFSKHIPYSQCKEMIDKLRGLSNQYFSARVKYIRNLPENMPTNRQLFYTIDVLDEAIEKNRQVAFLYTEIDIDKKPHPRLDNSGAPREYVVNPYQIVATNGRYYLIANYDKYDNVSHYRLDRISEIKMRDELAKPMNKVQGLEHGLNLPTHMAEHIYMFSGPSVRGRFHAGRSIVSEIIDWFGIDTAFSDVSENCVLATVNVNEGAMFYWLLQYGPYVEVLEPESLRKRVAESVQQMYSKYRKVED